MIANLSQIGSFFRKPAFLYFAGLAVFVLALMLLRSGARVIPPDIRNGEGNQNLNENWPFAWPGWLGPRRDGVSPETGLLESWPEEGPPLAWEARMGAGYSSSAIAGGRLVTMAGAEGYESVVCLNADTGKVIWQRSYPADYAGMDPRFKQGPRSTPFIDGDRVYSLGATGILACWGLPDGQEMWKHDLREEFEAQTQYWGMSFSPLVSNDRVFTLPGGKKGSLAAFDKITGRLIWSARDDKGGYSSPILMHAAGKSQLICFTGTHLVSVAPADGTEYWSLPWETDYDLNVATPLVIEGDLFVSTGYGRGSARLRVTPQDGDRMSAVLLYRNKKLSNQFTNSVHHGGHIYGFDRSGGHLVCLDYATGKERWREGLSALGSLLVADGKLIVLLADGHLLLVQANPREYQEISHFRFSTYDKCWAAPALANGKLYVRAGRKLACFNLTP